MSVADSISFNNFCQLCVKIYEASRDKKTEILRNYIESWKKKAEALKKHQPNVDGSFFPVLRFLLPQLDRERGAYGVKEYTLAKMYIRILSLPKESAEAAKFLNYKSSKGLKNETTDFADTAFWILKKRCTGGSSLSIEEVNNRLNSLATKHALNEPRNADSELLFLLKEMSAEEQKWLIRILLKDLKLGIGANEILKVYHPDAKNLYEANNDLRKVCGVLQDLRVRLNEIEIELFSPVKPMLSEEFDFQKFDAYLKKCQYFYVETKLDGERFQLHMKDGSFKYFSRGGFDYTANFGASQSEGILTPRIASQFQSSVRSCILDGEMMSWDSEAGKFASKGKNIDVKNCKNNLYKSCFCVFDILFHNDQILTNKPLNYRLELLNEAVTPLTGSIMFVSRTLISTKEEIIASLNEAIDNREEGIVLKEFISVYKPNVRKHSGWYKLKPEYADGLSDTLDLLIIGGYNGSGRHSGNISHFLLGVCADSQNDSKLFFSIARVGSGYTMDELFELQRKLEPYWHRTKAGEMPPSIEWTVEKPDVWVEPEKSYILEIKAAEIISSKLFKTGCSLRFPRVEKVRYDKCWKDCTTVEQIIEKQKLASGKLASHHFHFTENHNTTKKKTERSDIVLGSQYKGIDTSSIEKISNILSGKEICVLTGFGKLNKSDIEKKVIELGGTLVRNPGKNTYWVLAESDSNVRIKNIIKCGSHDIVRSSWFYSQVSENNLPQCKPSNYLAMSTKTSKFFSTLYDECGDHYTELLTKDSIKCLLKTLKKEFGGLKTLTINQKYDLDVKLFSGLSPYSIFRKCVAYFDQFSTLEDSSSTFLPNLESFKINFRFRGGKCVNNINESVTHVVIFSRDFSRLEEIKQKNNHRSIKYKIVSETWIDSTIFNQKNSLEGYIE